MQLFAEEYFNQNPGVAPDSDTLYTICFAIIMLNTDLHNPAIQSHMTRGQFVRLVPTGPGGYPSQELLEAIYDRIHASSLIENQL